MNVQRILIVSAAIVLLGQGCFGGAKVDSKTDGGVWKTADAGENWTQANALPGAKAVGTISGANILTMEMDPQFNKVLYLGTRENGILFTYDGAETWQRPLPEAMRTGAVSDIEVDPKSVCTVYAAKGQRLYKTMDCSRTFDSETYVETRTGVTVLRVAVDWFNTNVVWLGLSNGDILKSEDGGKTWRTTRQLKNEVTAMLINEKDSRIILIGTKDDGFYKTTDSGDTWTQVQKELKDFRNGDKVLALVQEKGSGVVIAATKHGLLRSRDFGTSWESIALLTSPGQVTIKALAVDPNNANRLYYAASSTFYSSTDGGNTWTTRRIPTTRIPEAMLLDPVDPKIVFVGAASAEK